MSANLKKLAVKFPLDNSTDPTYVTLMYFYVGADNVPTSQLREIPYVRAVELYAPYKFDGADVKNSDALFLPTIEKHSRVVFRNPSSGSTPWKLFTVGEDGAESFFRDFRPKLEVVAHVRCPLLRTEVRVTGNPDGIDEQVLPREVAYPRIADEKDYVIRFSFEFEDTDKPNDKWHAVAGFQTNRGDDSPQGDPEHFKWRRAPASTVFEFGSVKWNIKEVRDSHSTPENGQRNLERNPPRLLYWKDFCLGPFPVGRHSWRVGLEELKGKNTSSSIQAKGPRCWGLNIKYYCKERSIDPYKGWGRTQRTASRLWPLQIAPVKNSTAEEAAEDQHALRALLNSGFREQQKDGRAEWALECNWLQPPRVAGEPEVTPEEPFSPFGAWNQTLVAPYLNSLGEVSASNSGSVIPYFTRIERPDEQRWTLKYDLIDRRPHFPDKGTDRDKEQIDTEDLEVNFESLNLDGERAVEAKVELRNFLDNEGSPVTRTVHVKGNAAPEDGPAVSLSFTDVTTPASDFKVLRVGALDLHFGASEDVNQRKQGQVTLRLDGLKKLGDSAAGWHTTIDALLYYHLSAFGPGGQDPTPLEDAIPEEDRPNTIIAPYDGGGATLKGRFLLVARERNSREFTHTLALRLESLASQVAKPVLDFVVLDQNPFLIVRVRSEMDFSNEVGNWSGGAVEGPSWELRDSGKGFDLILPPQVVGEEFLKAYAPGEDTPDPNETLNYKFSPAATFRLSRTPFEQNFSETPWNIRRLLGYPGQRMPGMGIFSMEFELLYGLTTTVTTENLRLAESGARWGRLPGFLAERTSPFVRDVRGAAATDALGLNKEYEEYRAQYNIMFNLAQTRLSLLTPWSPAQPGDVLTLDKGVNYHFRRTRNVAHPISPKLTSNNYKPHPAGLRGGVDWGFESLNVYNEVLRQNSSTSGRLISPSFTALGGSGFQRAGFANDKSTIYSDTFLGRTFFYSLERIGRIGMLWNVAKHVIIYERSVADSEQFPDAAGNWLGRPVVRKLREFVEILQPERAYPEFGEAPKECGFVLGSKFTHKIFPVDSKWGKDVPDGWVVPIHMPGATPSSIYKEPDVFLRMSTSDGTGREHVWCRITNPEILNFYTSTRADDTVNTDTWAAVPDVDFPVEDLVSVPREAGAQVPGSPDAMLPDPPSVHAGYERFTFHLNAAGQTINLLAGRNDKSTEAVVENVSVIRRSLKSFRPELANSPERLRIQQAVVKGGEYVKAVQAQSSEILTKVGTADFGGALASMQAALGAQVESVTSIYGGLPTHEWLSARQADIVGRWKSSFSTELVAYNDKLLKELGRYSIDDLLSAKADVQRILEEAAVKLKAAEVLVDKVQQTINRAAGILEYALGQIFDDVEGYRGRLAEAAETIDVAEYQRLVIEAVGKIQQSVLAHKNQLGGSYPALFNDILREVDNALKRADSGIEVGLFPAPPPDPEDQAAVEEWFANVEVEESLNNIVLAYEAARLELDGDADKINGELDLLRQQFEDILDKHKFADLADEIIEAAKKGAAAGVKAAEDRLRSIARDFEEQAYRAVKDALDDAEVVGLVKKAFGDVAALESQVKEQIASARSILTKLQSLAQGIDDRRLLQAYKDLVAAVPATLTSALSPYERAIKERAQQFDLKQFGPEVDRLRERTLRLVRAHGLAPIAEGLKLNRERLSYYFQDIAQDVQGALAEFRVRDVIDFTPATVLVNRLGRELENLDLKSVGIRLPSFSVGEKFLPVNLKDFRPSLRDILPDFAGLNLSRLFDGVDFPFDQGDAVKITHGFNPTTLQTWAQCDVNMDLSGERELFSLGLFKLTVNRCTFTAHTRIDFDKSGAPRRNVEATIKADWQLDVSGQMVLTISNAILHFNNDGKLNFKMAPEALTLNPTLSFLTDLIRTLRPGTTPGSPIQLIYDGLLPVGVRVMLYLPLPTVTTGAFTVSNLSLALNFELGAPNGQFYIGLGLGLSSKERPFNLTILILGGGGWVNVTALYRPFSDSNRLAASLSIGIAAGASVAFDIGVAVGSVYFLVSIGVEYFYGGGANALTILHRVQVSGEVVLLGFISINILLALEARYTRGGALTCVGTLRVSMKIGWFFKISINKSVQFTLAGKSGGPGGQEFVSAESTATAIADPTRPQLSPGGGEVEGPQTGLPQPADAAARREDVTPHSQNVERAVDNYLTAFGD